ncbi:MAG: DUF1684 domain-containing protein [Acidobacteriota bacterium]
MSLLRRLTAVSVAMMAATLPLRIVARGGAGAAPRTSYQDEIGRFREARAVDLKAADGWLTVAGLFWLKPGPNVAGSAPGSDVLLPAKAPARLGVFTLVEERVTFVPAAGAGVTAAGKPVASAIEAPADDAAALASGDLRMFVIRRDDRFGVRLRDLKNPSRAQFRALRYFPVRTAYRVRATFVAYAQPRTIRIPNVLGQVLDMSSPGYVTFTIGGRQLRLEPVFETDEHEDFFFIFKDLTSRDATYGAGRFLHTPLPRAGMVDLDFNKAYNPPCAFTDFATCPLPPKENQLDVRIEAGELAYHLRPTGRQ